MAALTPEEIGQIIEQFLQTVGTRQYIGARYVPIFGRKGEDSIEWDNTAPYEPLTIVLYQGNSYTSRQYVPTGIEIDNTDFWAATGRYNAQIEAYITQVQLFDGRITANENAISLVQGSLPQSAFDANDTVKDYIDTNISLVQDLLPQSAFDTTNTVKAYIDASIEDASTAFDAKVFPKTSNQVVQFMGLYDFFRDSVSSDQDVFSTGSATTIGNNRMIFALRGNRDGQVDSGGSLWLADFATSSCRLLLRSDIGHTNGVAFSTESNILYNTGNYTTLKRYRFDSAQQTLVSLADITPDYSIGRIAIDPITDTLYGFVVSSEAQGAIVTIDKDSGSCEILTTVPEGYRGVGNGMAAYNGVVYIGSGTYLSASLTGFDVTNPDDVRITDVRYFDPYFDNGLLCRELQGVSFDENGDLYFNFAMYGLSGGNSTFTSFGVVRANHSYQHGVSINRLAATAYVDPSAGNVLSDGSSSRPFHTIEPLLYFHPQVNPSTIELVSDYNHKMIFSHLLDAKVFQIRSNGKVIAGMQIVGACNVKVYYSPIFRPTLAEHLTSNAIISATRCGGLYVAGATFDTQTVTPTYLASVAGTACGIDASTIQGDVSRVRCTNAPYSVSDNITVVTT